MTSRNVMAVLVCINICAGSPLSMAQIRPKTNADVQYQFKLDEGQTRRLSDSAASLKIGDSLQDVKNKLGNPDVERDLLGKKGEFKFRSLQYYAARVDIKGSNTHDKLLSLYFDKGGHRVEIKNMLE